jgi:hydrogenase nickel incorporation protein HypA/HybF
MHELQATRGMLDVALAAAADAGASGVVAIDVVIGDMTSMVDDSVQFYFDVLSRDTAAAGARLRFRREPALGRCGACEHEFEARPPLARACPLCGSLDLVVTGGQAFYVESIEVADEGARSDGYPEGERPGGESEQGALP